jgi:hypothetical protein
VRRPYIRSKRVAVTVGLVLLAASFVVLYDAWDGRGGKKPLILGPILPW